MFYLLQGKVIVINDDLKVVYDDSVSYDLDLPEFGTKGGIHLHDDKSITAPTAMFVKTLDILLGKMRDKNFPFGDVIAVAGATQCNSSVYWKRGSRQKLKSLVTDRSLFDQLKDAFSVADAPTWMDSTVTEEARQIEEAVGGQEEMIRVTGGRAFENSTAAQIKKIYQTRRDAYENTERISLISSLIASLFLGDYAPVDYGDASTTNLLNIHSKRWFAECLNVCGNDLHDKLGEPQVTHTTLGNISAYLTQRYGFSCHCKLLPFTGDTMQTMIGLAANKDEIIMSLGTADCILKWSDTAEPNLISRAMVSCLDHKTKLSLMAFKNGSITRQRVMERCSGTWENFSKMLKTTPPGNNGNIGMYFDVIEKQPLVMGRFRFNKDGEAVSSFPSEVEARAVIEGQFLARRMYLENAGYPTGPNSRIIVTGGASTNVILLQIITDVLNVRVYSKNVPNSAALGGCYRAKLVMSGSTSFETLEGLSEPTCVAVPTPEIQHIYTNMLARYKALEEYVAANFGEKNNEIKYKRKSLEGDNPSADFPIVC